MYQVICFGEVLWDNFPTGKKVGGAPLNVALHLFKQELDSRIVSSVGNDKDGEDIKSFLQNYQLDTSLIQVHPRLQTGSVEIELDTMGQARYSISEPVAWDEITYFPALHDIVNKADAIVFGTLALRNETSRNTLLQLLPSAQLKILDLNLRPPHFTESLITELIAACDILKINEHELDYLKDLYQLADGNRTAILNQLAERTLTKTICVTLGEKGAMVLHNGEHYSHAGFKVTVADTVGAGDAFLATFISGYLQHLPMDRILLMACGAGALVASKPGATPDYSLSDIIGITG